MSQRHYPVPEAFSRTQSFRSVNSQMMPLVRIRKRRFGNWIKIVIDGRDFTPRPMTHELFPSTTLDGSWDWEMASAVSSQAESQITLAGTLASVAVLDDKSDVLDEWAPSEEYIGQPQPSHQKMDVGPATTSDRFTILLQESPTFFLLQLPFHWLFDESQPEVGSPVTSADAEIQTLGPNYRSSMCQTPHVIQTTIGESVHPWTIYDSTWPKRRRHRSSKPHQMPSAESGEMPKKLFVEATLWVERLLYTTNLQASQMELRRKPPPPDNGIKYHLKPLWTFPGEYSKGTCVTAMAWNEFLPDVLAVGYGKFNFNVDAPGAVCLWCFKNPGVPERHYTFEEPVTALTFSNNSPNLLGVSFYDGKVMIVDVSSATARILAQCDRLRALSFSPIWQLSWTDDGIVAMGDDGRICR